MTDWHVGMRVVCVLHEWWENDGPAAGPTFGQVCVIERVEIEPDEPYSSNPYFLLEGFHGLDTDGLRERFSHEGFRPVRETKTDISIFRKLIEPSELAKFRERIEA